MITVNLIAETNQDPEELTSHAANTCYTSKLPEMGKKIPVESALFKTGHHTTLQHSFFTFAIEGISVGAVKFGLHMVSPFYNSDERSGRYSKMYDQPDLEGISEYISHYYPDLSNKQDVLDFIKMGTDIYAENISDATKLTTVEIKKERPFLKDESIEKSSPKIAQEQLRNFISLIAPTALDFTINLSVLTALYRSAWSPELRDVYGKMKDIVLEKYPEIDYMFKEDSTRKDDWAPKKDLSNIHVKKSPEVTLLACDVDESSIDLNIHSEDAVDTNYFTPEKMENNVNTIKTEIEISSATLGQDQRHRTIKRSAPEFTGAFYLPELMQKVPGLTEKAKEFMQKWAELSDKIPATLATSLAPYGAMVKYKKLSDMNALQHEQGKRTCWCAQEEIYWVAVLTRKALEEKGLNKVCEIFAPSCYSGKCIEGNRYCGRDLKCKKDSGYFPHRLV